MYAMTILARTPGLTSVVDLALAISKSIEAKVWNVILIILILVNTIICCHYLIRLCMLAMHARQQNRTGRVPSEADENGFAQPQRPIRVILARDEELGLHDNEEGPITSSVPPPPPAYGLWRCSVVCKSRQSDE